MFKRLAIAVLLVSVVGCGTVSSMQGYMTNDSTEHRLAPMSGVDYDLHRKPEDGRTALKQLFDLPCSLVADTILLPFLIWK